MNPLSPEFWGAERGTLLAVLLPAIEEIAIAGANIGLDNLAQVGITLDPELTHAQAARWAREHTDALLERFNTVTQGSVGEIVQNWIATPGATRADLEARLLPILNENVARAESVGVTEVTRAMAQGEYQSYTEAGIALPPTFSNGVDTAPFGPPAHPRCRCWTRVVRLPDNTWVTVWATNRDELVCQQKLRTPFGEVNGCRSLHNRVLSAGKYLGMTLAEAKRTARNG